MNNALDGGHLPNVVGENSENVGQENEEHQNEGSSDWKEQSKYFQSEKDKLYSENQKLKQYEQLGNLMESRPDIAETVTSMLDGQPQRQENIEVERDEFDAWEALNDPNSKSYKLSEQKLSDKIQAAVDVNMGDMNQKVGMQNLEQQLRNKGLSETEVASFFEFANKNPAQHGVDGAIKMWQAVTQPDGVQKTNPLDAVRKNQGMPQQAGILQGGQPESKSTVDNMWKSIMGASRVGNKIP